VYIIVSFGHTITIDPLMEEVKSEGLALGNKILRYQALNARGKYITVIAKIFDKKLGNAVLSVTSHLYIVKENLRKLLNNFGDTAIKEMSTNSEKLLQKSVLELIKLTGDIKTTDVS